MKAIVFCFLVTLGSFINSISAQSDSLITVLEKALRAQVDSLGEEHLDVAIYCDSLGKIYMEAGIYPQADTLFKKG